jgi:hypothetical protein
MLRLMGQLGRDERGCVEASEWMLVASILTLSALAGMAALCQVGW